MRGSRNRTRECVVAAALMVLAGVLASESVRAQGLFFGADARIEVLRAGQPVTLSPAVGSGEIPVLDTDQIDAVTVGESGVVGEQIEGTLTLQEVSAGSAARNLGDVDVEAGELSVQRSTVAGSATVGVANDTAFTDPSAGRLTLSSSSWDGAISVSNGEIDGIESEIGSLSVRALGDASLLGATVGGLLVEQGGAISVRNSTIGPSNTAINGDATIAGASITGATGTVRTGNVVLRTSGVILDGVDEPRGTDWTVSGEFRVDGGDDLADPPTALDVSGDVTAASTRIGGLTKVDVTLRGAESRWSSVSGGTIVSAGTAGTPGTLEIRDGADYIDGDVFRIYRFLVHATGAGSRLRVDGDLRVGERVTTGGSAALGPGTLRVSDGATIEVLGTLTVHPDAELILDPGGTVYAGAFENDGVVTENGGAIVVPEPNGAAPAACVALAVTHALRARRRA